MLTKTAVTAQNRRWTKRINTLFMQTGLFFCTVGLIMGGCASTPSPSPEESAQNFITEQTRGAVDGVAKETTTVPVLQQAQLPVRYQKLSYNLNETGSDLSLKTEPIMVGASISAKGPMALKIILSELTNLKKFSISWESDVNKDAVVHVPAIQADEDFFEVIDNILRQYDYSYEVQGRTIIVKHKVTKNFHIAMPFMASTFSTSVGGDVLGSTQGANMSGTLNISSENNGFDIWGNIQSNLDKILEIWTTPVAQTPTTTSTDTTTSAEGSASSAPATTSATPSAPPVGLGYYTIDKPIGLISVTAPKPLIEKVGAYLDNLKSELYRQVSIEAKIVEVSYTNNDTTGVDWSTLFTETFDFAMSFTKMNFIKSSATTPKSFISIGDESFTAVLDAMKKQGHVEVLSNPKISVMNGQPAMISVGENVTYVDSVSSTTTDGVTTYSVNTASVMSGLGLGVIASITSANEVILNLTPVTSDLTEPIEYVTFGDNQVGLPKVSLRELSTIVRVKSGEMLVIGGLIDNSSTYTNDYVAGLGELPIAGQAFRTDGTATSKKELIVLLRPRIHSL